MTTCFGLRLTPCEIDPSANRLHFIHLFNDLIRTYNLVDYALGWEQLNKYGEPTKPHYHFNFLADGNKQAIQTHIRRWDMYRIKGNTMYALTRYSEPDDFNRWFRYVAKEKLLRKYCKGFTDLELDEMELLAKDERKRSISYNLEKRQSLLEKKTLYDKYSIEIEKTNLKTFKSVWLKFLELYVRDRKIINPSTIKGYTNLYLLQKKYITHEQFFADNNPGR